jgi:hypothetical protein
MKTMLKLREFCQNYHSFVVKLLAKFIRRGISVEPIDRSGGQNVFWVLVFGAFIIA